MIATSIEEGRVQEGNKLDRGGSIPPSIRDPSLGITWELPGAERGVQVDGSLAPHRLPPLNVGFLSLNLCEMWRGILKQTTLHSFCLHCFFLPIFFLSSLGLQEGNENICSYQECSSKPVFPPSLPDAMILVKEINSFTGRDT